jgi:serine/threonine-protein kinase
MSRLPTTRDQLPPLTVLRRVDQLCTEFEEILKAGGYPNVDEWVTHAAPEAQDEARKRLQSLVEAYGRRSDELTTPAGGDEAITTPPHPPYPPKASSGEPLPRSFGKYTLEAYIGDGGMGVVYKAWDPDLQRHVALKLIRPDRYTSVVERERFRNEARAVAKLEHPNIIAIHDFNEVDGQLFFTMDFVEGGSLAKHLDIFQFGTLDRKQESEPRRLLTGGWSRKQRSARRQKILFFIEKVCRAVHAVHSIVPSIIHRDLKPGNILLKGDEPKVSDFGLAKVVSNDSTGDNHREYAGTPAYMSPEQLCGDPDEIAPASDVWALGVILYELFTGQRPYEGRAREDVREAVFNGPLPKRPRELNPAIDKDLDGVIRMCLKREPTERYATAEALANDLVALLEGRAPEVLPDSWVGGAARITRRHWLAATSIGVVGLGGASFSVAQMAMNYYRDPRRRLEGIQRDLRRGKPVVLIGEEGMPVWYEWHGVPGSFVPGDREGNPMTLTSGFTSLLELLPEVDVKAFRLTAQIRYMPGQLGPVGLYLGRSDHQLATGTLSSFVLACFDENPDQSGKCTAELVVAQHHHHPNPDFGFHDKASLNAALPFEVRIEGKPRPPRELALESVEDEVRFYWDGRAVGCAPLTMIQQRGKTLLINHPRISVAEAREIQPKYRPSEGLGILVRECTAAVRNVIIAPL